MGLILGLMVYPDARIAPVYRPKSQVIVLENQKPFSIPKLWPDWQMQVNSYYRLLLTEMELPLALL